jgi:hypothetical protein
VAGFVNKGINISGGGSITGGNFAIGDHSQLEVHQTDMHGLGEQLEALTRAIAAFQGPSETREAMTVAHDEIAAELQTPRPDTNKILAKLSSITHAVGSAGTVASAATALATALQLIL